MKKMAPAVLCALLGVLALMGVFVETQNEATAPALNAPTKNVAASKESAPEEGKADEAEREDAAPSAETVQAELAEIVNATLAAYGVDTSQIGLVVHDFATDACYTLNPDTYFTAASTYKLPLAMVYYDQIAQGTRAATDGLLYEAYEYEEGGPVGASYAPGAVIATDALLHWMILESDNTAAHILYENLGGWLAFKDAIAAYSESAIPADDAVYHSYENRFTAGFMNDVLDYLYRHAADYSTLLEDLQAAKPDDYLNAQLGDAMAQKYGQYDMAENAVGLSRRGHPYSVAIYTNLGYTGRCLIGDLNAALWDYFNPEK